MSDAALHPALQALSGYLSQRREQILRAWHARLDADPELTAFSSLSRAQFNDHVPAVLEGFEQRLLRVGRPDEANAAASAKASAAEHGLHRWQQGYDQRQTMREWGHLQLCLLDELEQFAVDNPQLEPRAMSVARRALARMCSDGVIESGTRYLRLQQAEATS